MGTSKSKRVAGLALAVISSIATGCGGTERDVLTAFDEKRYGERSFEIPMGQAWDAARAAIQWNGAVAVEEYPERRLLLGIAGPSAVSWGQAMGVWVDPVNAHATRIRVVVSPVVSTNVTAPTESSVLDDIERAIVREKQGLPLPDEDPD
jgi:hypothetical protein